VTVSKGITMMAFLNRIGRALKSGFDQTLELDNADLHFTQKQMRARRILQRGQAYDRHRELEDAAYDRQQAMGYKIAGGRGI
jgi:hypothetical protein